jgi:hypothetical protein
MGWDACESHLKYIMKGLPPLKLGFSIFQHQIIVRSLRFEIQNYARAISTLTFTHKTLEHKSTLK